MFQRYAALSLTKLLLQGVGRSESEGTPFRQSLQNDILPEHTLWAGFTPPWLLALWVLFAIQVNVLFRWLRGRWLLAMMLGAVAGPLSFRAGAALGAAQIPEVAVTMGVLAAGWALWLPMLVWMGQRSDGTRALP